MSEGAQRGRATLVRLDSLLLDPNDPRLIEDPRWRPVPEADIATRRVQAITAERLLATHYDPVITLMDSIARYGWVEAEPIRVRALVSGGLVVVDGNRRVLALRRLQEPATAVEAEQSPRVHEIWVWEEASDDRDAELARAVRHTERTVGWNDFSRAMWWREQRRAHPDWPSRRVDPRRRSWPPEDDENDDLVLEMCEDYVASPWGEELSRGTFMLFRAALKHEAIRSWLGYGSEAGPDGERVLRFFAWTKGDPSPANGHDEEQHGPSIPNTFTMSQLAKLLAKPGFVESIEREGAIGPAWRKATSRPRRVSEVDWSVKPVEHWAGLASLSIERYRGLTGVELHGLTKVNVLVGVNNAGKTSVLEAIYLLCRQADPRGLLDTVRARIRADPDALPTAEWVRLVPKSVAISSRLADGTVIRVEQSTTDEPLDESTDVATLVTTLRIEAQRDHERQVSVTELHTEPPRSTQLLEGTRTWLAPAVFHSPFSLAERKLLIRCHERSVEEGVEALLIDFIRQHIDPGVESIDLVGSGRFLVQHRTGGHLDLSSYGEGMQRVFQLALLFAAHARGIVLIDELENALHTNVIIAFSRMIQELAVRFDVQVFLTTHSKETIDAFLLNGYRTEDVSTFLLRREVDLVSVRRFDGDTLARAIEAGDVDIRGL